MMFYYFKISCDLYRPYINSNLNNSKFPKTRNSLVNCEKIMFPGDRFNAQHPPKPVNFVETFLIQWLDLPGSPIMSCEPRLPGVFRKFNNNAGYVSEDARSTPQAFSHFSYVV